MGETKEYLDKEGLRIVKGHIDNMIESNGSKYVPITRTINNKELSSDITLSASDVGALPDTTTIPTESTVSGWGFTKNTGNYSKPSSGIPKSDLDSSVQESLGKVDGLNNNLDGLGYGENGAYNLLKVSEDNIIIYSNDYSYYKLTDDGFITTGYCLIGFIVKVKPNTKYFYGAIGNNCLSGNWKIREFSSKPSSYEDNSFIIQSVNGGNELGISTVFTTSENTQYILVCKYEENTNAVISQMQITESDVATPYKPYIPSVKMLADKTTQIDDLKMLGWTVPRECPIRNYIDSDRVFHQRVGRVDLGSLNWNYADDCFISNVVSNIKTVNWTTKFNGYCSLYIIATYINMSNKTISVNDDNSCIYIKDSKYTDATTFKNAMQGVYLYYELAEEILIKVDGNEAVTKVNDSLGDYGFKIGNRFDGLWSQGYYSGFDTIVDASIFVCSTNKFSCNAGEKIRFEYSESAKLYFVWFSDTDRLSQVYSDGEVSVFESVVPTGATQFAIQVNKTLTPSTAKNAKVTIVDDIPKKVAVLKSDLSTHTHNYAGSPSSGGSANSAVKLDSSAGSATQPVYFSGGKPVATTYTLGTSVPSGAVFTDTKNTAGSTDTSSKIYLVGATSQVANPQTYSDNQVYATNGQLNGNSVRIAEKVIMQYNSTTESLDFIFG